MRRGVLPPSRFLVQAAHQEIRPPQWILIFEISNIFG